MAIKQEEEVEVVTVVDSQVVNMSKRKHHDKKMIDDEDKSIFEYMCFNKKQKTSNDDKASLANISILVERIIATLEVAAEEDADLNRKSQPAINKLKKVPLLTQFLSKKHLQLVFLDHGILCLLKNWLEPLPDGSLPNVIVRTAILQTLSEYPIDLSVFIRREQLKKSGLGKVIMFLSMSDEETTSNKKLARDLVYKWSRPIFNISTRYEDMKSMANEAAEQRLVLYQPRKKPALMYRDADLDFSKGLKSSHSSSSTSTQYVSRPEPLAMDFVVRPPSKINRYMIRETQEENKVQLRIQKKLRQLKKWRRPAAPCVKAFPILCV
ncbi:hypothetical protein AQUCO_00300912v1 [Aquilegia coerulea]|uniref:TFIIS N-terminal domain-containing protein n=1 Tax=Aquilegia coerulea TaxID=218851 RepID=A0A2G5F158_AQUCA|nr:hypothetical protein AQUCO_00300912v1 [Aquilegia coerulea]